MPDIHCAKDAHDYCKALWRLMTFAGVTYGDLYNGNMRFDVNISLAPEGSDKLGTRAEIKNLNSFRSVERAVEYEISRQAKLLKSGEEVIQETRGWNDATGETTAQRSKEAAKDYRYMPEPDIPPLNLDAEFIDHIAATLPLMPSDYRARFSGIIREDTLEVLLDYPALMAKLGEISEIGLDESSTSTIIEPGELSKDGGAAVVLIANLFATTLLAEEKSAEYLNDLPTAHQLAELATMNRKNELSSTATKDVFLHFFDPNMHSRSARQIASELGVLQENDPAALEKIVDTVLADPKTKKAQEDFKAGEEKVLGFLVGQVMKASHGQANPGAVQKILREKLSKSTK